MARGWMDAVLAAGAVRAGGLPEAAAGRTDSAGAAEAAVVEGDALASLAVPAPAVLAPVASFLDGVQHWRVACYAGVTPIVQGWVAAAVRRRGAGRTLRTTLEDARELLLTRPDGLTPAVRAALERSGLDVVDLGPEAEDRPGRALELARQALNAARVRIETALAERALEGLGPEEWLVVDGLLSESARVAAHPRTLGVIKSHGAQYFTGAALETAFTLPAGRRTSVFEPRPRARHRVYSWYLRLWPWEGNDLLYGLLRLEARAAPETVRAAGAVSAWMLAERAPVPGHDARWDRLLYPIGEVEAYLKARAPRDLLPPPASHLPRPGA